MVVPVACCHRHGALLPVPLHRSMASLAASMTDKIVKFPGQKLFPNTVSAREIWDQEEPPQEMVWAVCPWVRRGDEIRCPPLPALFRG